MDATKGPKDQVTFGCTVVVKDLEFGDTEEYTLVGAGEEDYDAGRIKIHEKTRPDKEDDRTRLIDTISADTGLADIRRLAEADERRVADKPGTSTPRSVFDAYIEHILADSAPSRESVSNYGVFRPQAWATPGFWLR